MMENYVLGKVSHDGVRRLGFWLSPPLDQCKDRVMSTQGNGQIKPVQV